MSNVGWSSSSNRPFHVCGSEFLFLLWFLLVLTADVRLFLSKSVPPLTFRCVLSELQEIWWAFQWMSGFSEGTKRRGDITNILWRPHTNSHNQYCGPNTACLVLYWLTVSSESCNREENLMRIFRWQNKNLQKTWWRQLREQKPTWHSRYSFVYWPRTKEKHFSNYHNVLLRLTEIDSYDRYVFAPVLALFIIKKLFNVVLGFVGNDASAVHLHDGAGAGHQEQCDLQKDRRAAAEPLLPSMEVHTHILNCNKSSLVQSIQPWLCA